MTYLVTPLSFLILSFSFQSLSMRIRQILFPLLSHFFLVFVARQFQLLGLMRMERFLRENPESREIIVSRKYDWAGCGTRFL